MMSQIDLEVSKAAAELNRLAASCPQPDSDRSKKVRLLAGSAAELTALVTEARRRKDRAHREASARLMRRRMERAEQKVAGFEAELAAVDAKHAPQIASARKSLKAAEQKANAERHELNLRLVEAAIELAEIRQVADHIERDLAEAEK